MGSCKVAARHTGSENSPECPNEVVVRLQSDVLIPDYSRYYDTPIADFKGPTYRPLDDGSLVTDKLVRDLRNAYITLIVLVILAVIFLRNTFVSAGYIRRARIQQKALFYLLHFSQLLGFVGTLPQIVTFFQREPNCPATILAVSMASPISLSLLMTGILGYKAYKCLEDSLFVAVVLFLFFACYSAATVFDIIHMRGVQKLSGNCARVTDIKFTRMAFILEFAQSVFLCLCFLFAVWKSRGSPIFRKRISNRLSFEESPGGRDEDRKISASYGPAASGGCLCAKSRSDGNSISFNHLNDIPRLRTLFSTPDSKRRPTSLTSEHLLSNSSPQEGNSHPSDGRATLRQSIAPSTFSRISRYVPRMQLFHKVMKDELCYTLAITSTYVVSTVLSVIGINFQTGLPIVGWIGVNWIVMSVLAMHSFERVLRRHEREALVQRILIENGWQNNGFNRHHRLCRPSSPTWGATGASSEANYSDNIERQSSRRTSKGSSFLQNNLSHAPYTQNNPSSITPLSISSPIAVPPSARTPYTIDSSSYR